MSIFARTFVCLMMLLPLAGNAANAEYLKVILMQPKPVMMAKMDGIDGLDQYVKAVEVNINKKIAELPPAPAWGFLVIAVREDGKIKAWVDTDDNISPVISNAMIEVAESTKSFSVKTGAVVFALGFGVDDAGLPVEKMPFPVEWKKISNCTNEDCMQIDTEAVALKAF
ncbi:MAG: hypothetical protein ABL880_06960 [Methylotenera sp.]